MDLRIRDATAADAAELARIYNQSVVGSTASFDLVPQSAQERAAWMATHGPRHPVIVGEEGGRIVGWGSLSQWSTRGAYSDTVEITVYVDAGRTGRGVGRTLDTELLRLAAEHGHRAVIAQVSAENAASVALVESLGFEHVGTLRKVGRKFGRSLDVLLYEKLV